MVASPGFREPEPGDFVLHYRVGDRLGAGGMGHVYRAIDTRLGRDVALKFLPPDRARDPDSRSRLLKEARAAASLRSPHIAVTFDIAEHEGSLFIVMEYVEGTLVSERIAQGPLSIAVTIDLAIQIADALDEAHSYGVVHRDIKSANIIVTARGLAKVLDFGVAKLVPTAAAPVDVTLIQDTSPGLVLGTIAYMSPEQIRARPVDHRSDIFSLGVVLYEMVTGRLPFQAGSVAEVADAILNREPAPPARFNYDVPVELEAIIRKALQKNPDYRYQSAREFHIDLHNLTLARDGGDSGPAATRGLSTGFDGTRAATGGRPPTIAVMSFANITGDAADAWIGSGIAETVTTDLKAVHGLQVISRAQVVDILKSLSGDDEGDVDDRLAIEVGRRLGATWIVGGGYQRLGDRIRITSHLIEVDGGGLLRTVKIDGRIDEIFALQDRLVYGLSQSLNLTLDRDEVARIGRSETESVEAFEAFSRGLDNLRQGDIVSLDRAIHLLEKATQLDPNYAAAWAALATAFDLKAGFLSLPDLAEKAVALARHAIELDPTSANAHRWLGSAYLTLGRYDEAIESMTEAVRLDPDHANAHAGLARAYWIGKGKIREAIRLFSRAVQINPGQGYSFLQLAFLYAINGEYEKGMEVARSAVALQEQASSGREGLRIVGAHNRLGYLLYRQGRYDAAITEFERELAFLASNDHALADRVSIELYQKLAATYIAKGQPADARRYVELAIKGFARRVAKGADDPFTKYYIAALYALEGERDKALRYLEESSVQLAAINRVRLRTDPDFASLHGDPRFDALIREPAPAAAP